MDCKHSDFNGFKQRSSSLRIRITQKRLIVKTVLLLGFWTSLLDCQVFYSKHAALNGYAYRSNGGNRSGGVTSTKGLGGWARRAAVAVVQEQSIWVCFLTVGRTGKMDKSIIRSGFIPFFFFKRNSLSEWAGDVLPLFLKNTCSLTQRRFVMF